jgi:DNA-binding NtrC family response regulator
VRGSDPNMPLVKAVPGVPGGPPLRRRTRSAAAVPVSEPQAPESPAPAEAIPQAEHVTAAAEPAPGRAGVAEQAAQLRALLAEVGPRRAALAARLGKRGKPLPERVLLARFRSAGLERELGQRERDLLRGLFARHRGSHEAVAAELKIDRDALVRLVRERRIEQEIEGLGHRFPEDLRRRRH